MSKKRKIFIIIIIVVVVVVSTVIADANAICINIVTTITKRDFGDAASMRFPFFLIG